MCSGPVGNGYRSGGYVRGCMNFHVQQQLRSETHGGLGKRVPRLRDSLWPWGASSHNLEGPLFCPALYMCRSTLHTSTCLTATGTSGQSRCHCTKAWWLALAAYLLTSIVNLGCLNSPPASRQSYKAGITQSNLYLYIKTAAFSTGCSQLAVHPLVPCSHTGFFLMVAAGNVRSHRSFPAAAPAFFGGCSEQLPSN